MYNANISCSNWGELQTQVQWKSILGTQLGEFLWCFSIHIFKETKGQTHLCTNHFHSQNNDAQSLSGKAVTWFPFDDSARRSNLLRKLKISFSLHSPFSKAVSVSRPITMRKSL